MFGISPEALSGAGSIIVALFILLLAILTILMPFIIYLIYSNTHKSRQLLENIDHNIAQLVRRDNQ